MLRDIEAASAGYTAMGETTGLGGEPYLTPASHPNREPAVLPVRASASKTSTAALASMCEGLRGSSSVPLTGAGANQAWNDSGNARRHADPPGRRKRRHSPVGHVVFFANQYEDSDTGQPNPAWAALCSIPPDASDTVNGDLLQLLYLRVAPPATPMRKPMVDRMRFWTAVHEMGHAFNLLHSWQIGSRTPWVQLANEPESAQLHELSLPCRFGKVPAILRQLSNTGSLTR